MRGLQDKVIVVAGGAQGIGAATAQRLADEGAHVVIGDIAGDLVRETAERIDAGSSGTVLSARFDVVDEGSVRDLFGFAVDRLGGVDGVHFNVADLSAQCFGSDSDPVAIELSVWERTLTVDLTGFLLVARHAIPALLDRGGGALVATSSDSAFKGDVRKVGYAAAKAGLNSMCRHIASRWGREGIRANTVAPSLTLTETALQEGRPGWIDAVQAQVRSPRLGRPEDIAAMVAYLMSEDGEWINGQCYGVNGGLVFQ